MAISDACEENGRSLTGGETSEQPGVINEDTYILTSSMVGVVEKRILPSHLDMEIDLNKYII